MTASTETSSSATRARLIASAAVLMFLLTTGAALLPLADEVPGANVVGSLLLAAGVVELLAGTQRRDSRLLCMVAGAVTGIAGLILLLRPVTNIFPTVYLVVAWLVLRSLVLAVASTQAGRPVRIWTILAAATDLALALVVLAGISIATLIVGLFGPTPEVIASFAWVLALSFLVTALWLLAAASCERSTTE